MTRTTTTARPTTPEEVLRRARGEATPEELLRAARVALGAPVADLAVPARPLTPEEVLRRARLALGADVPPAAKPTAAERKPRAPRKARKARPVTTAALRRFPLAYPCNDVACFDSDRHAIGSAGCAFLEAPTTWGRVRKDRCGAYAEAPGCTYRREHRPGGSKRCRFTHERGDGHVTWRDADAMGDGDTPTDALVRRLKPGAVVEYGLNGHTAYRLFITDVERVDDMVRVAGVLLNARWFPVERAAARLSAASPVIVHDEDVYVRAAVEAFLVTPGCR